MEQLTPIEEKTMQAVWQTGEGNIKAFLENMEEQIAYTTIASVMKNLEKKNFVSSHLTGNVYIYKPKVSEAYYKRKFMGSVVENYFSNSYKELVNFFVEQNKLSAIELKEIISLIENGK